VAFYSDFVVEFKMQRWSWRDDRRLGRWAAR